MIGKPEIFTHPDQEQKAPFETGKPPARWNVLRLAQVLLVISLSVFALALNVSRAVRAEYNHDEDQFITSARLLLDEGLLPYRDYPYFHTPYLVFIYAGLFALTGGFNLLAARLFSALCATLSVMLVFWITLYFFRDHPAKVRWSSAAALLFLYLANPLLAAAASFGWNHTFPVLCMLGSLGLAMLAPQKKSPAAWFFASGVLLGSAVGARLSSLTLLPAFLLALIWLPGIPARRRPVRLGLSFLLGGALALLPLLGLFLTAPQQFVFGNLGYARLNTDYRLDVPVAYERNVPIYGTRTLADKLGFLWNDVLAQPPNLLLFAGLLFFGVSALAAHLGKNKEEAFGNILLLTAIPFAAVGSFLPTPTWYQYFYVVVPFAVLAIARGLAALTQGPDSRGRTFVILLVELVVLANAFMFQDFRRMSFLRYVDLWKPLVIHQVGMDIRDHVGPEGRVFTIAPLYPLEGGVGVYPPMVTGAFAFRTGSLLSADQRQQYGIVSAEDFEAYLDQDPPEGIFTGFDQVLEQQIIQYALDRGYIPHRLYKGLTLWVGLDPSVP